MIQANKALGYWISWAPDDSLLRGCHRQPTVRMETPRGTFRRVSTIFAGYRRVRSCSSTASCACPAWPQECVTDPATACAPSVCGKGPCFIGGSVAGAGGPLLLLGLAAEAGGRLCLSCART